MAVAGVASLVVPGVRVVADRDHRPAGCRVARGQLDWAAVVVAWAETPPVATEVVAW